MFYFDGERRKQDNSTGIAKVRDMGHWKYSLPLKLKNSRFAKKKKKTKINMTTADDILVLERYIILYLTDTEIAYFLYLMFLT